MCHRLRRTSSPWQLALAARAADRIGATVVVEALNPVENPRYPLPGAAEVVAVLDRLRNEAGLQLAWLCDVYHLQRGGADPAAAIARHGERIGHVQFADAPGRHEPGTGQIDFPRVFAELLRSGYTGRAGLEYRPSTTTAVSLERLRAQGLAPQPGAAASPDRAGEGSC